MNILGGCEPYRIEYHTRPAFYERAALGELPSEFVDEDGTIVRYQSSSAQSSLGRRGEDARQPFRIREEHEDGSITLRALLPEHVILNTLTCLRNEEYELLYEQMLAAETKDRFEQESGGLEGFASYMRRNRHDLVATLTRMADGMVHQEVAVTYLGDGVTRCRLRPQIASHFKIKSIYVTPDAERRLKLMMIE